MAGLLDQSNFGFGTSFDDPRSLGILGAAAGLLSAAGPSPRRVTLAEAMGQGLKTGMAGYQSGQQMGLEKQKGDLLKAQTDQAILQAKRQQALQDLVAGMLGVGLPANQAPQGSPQAGAQQPDQAQGTGLRIGMPPGLQVPSSDGGIGLRAPSTDIFSAQPKTDSGNPALQPQTASNNGIQPFGQQAPSGMQPKPGAFPFTMNQIAALSVLGAPGSKELLDIYKYSNDGVKREPGTFYEINGKLAYFPKVAEGATITQDGNIVPIPGAIDFNAAYKGTETQATEGAKARLDLVQVPMADGSTRMLPRDQAASILGGQAMMPRGAQQFWQNQQQGFGSQSGTPYTGAPGFGVSQSPGDKTYQEDAAKAAADQYKKIQDAGFTAPNKIAKFQQLATLLDDFNGSKLSPMGMELAQFAKSIGLNVDPKLPNKEAAMSLTNELALSLRNPSGGEGMPGNFSDADREFAVKTVPNLMQTAQGRRQLVDMQVKLLQRQADTAAMARKWAQRYGRLDAVNPVTGKSFFDNLQEWANRNPLFVQPEQ
jgi:hypothetical protein